MDVDKDDSDEEDTEVVIVSKKRKKQVKAAEKAPRSEAGRKRVTELVKTWRWDNLKLNPTLKWGEIPDKVNTAMYATVVKFGDKIVYVDLKHTCIAVSAYFVGIP